MEVAEIVANLGPAREDLAAARQSTLTLTERLDRRRNLFTVCKMSESQEGRARALEDEDDVGGDPARAAASHCRWSVRRRRNARRCKPG